MNSNLIRTATSESELAGAIAHQIGHLKLPQRPDPAATGTIPLVGNICIRERGGFVLRMGLLEVQGETESQADLLALGYMVQAGYDPSALADLFERILKPAPGSISRVFDPAFPESTRTRADAMRNDGRFVVTTSGFRDIQRRLAELPPQPAPANPPKLVRAPGH